MGNLYTIQISQIYIYKPEETAEQIEALAESMKRYKELRRKQKESRRGLVHLTVNVSPATGGGDSNALSQDSNHTNADGDTSNSGEKPIMNGSEKVSKAHMSY